MLLLSSVTGTGSWSTLNMIAQLFFILAVFIAVAVLAVFLTRTMGGAKYQRKTGGNLKIIESLGLGFQNGIHLVKAGNKHVLLGITKDRITFLCEVDELEAEELEATEKGQYSFENYLNSILGKRKD